MDIVSSNDNHYGFKNSFYELRWCLDSRIVFGHRFIHIDSTWVIVHYFSFAQGYYSSARFQRGSSQLLHSKFSTSVLTQYWIAALLQREIITLKRLLKRIRISLLLSLRLRRILPVHPLIQLKQLGHNATTKLQIEHEIRIQLEGHNLL